MNLIILGASARAAASSAIRAGLSPNCADFFADRDLGATCPVERIPYDFAGPVEQTFGPFVAYARRQSPSAWLYTGPFENAPDAVDEISATHRLLGNPGSALRAVRDPFRVAECLRLAGLPGPDVRLNGSGLPGDGSWLVKPLASGGGLGIAPFTGLLGWGPDRVYFQKRIPGRAYSALYLAALGRAWLVGVTRQFQGIAGRPFVYRGSIGPLAVPAALKDQLDAIGGALAAGFGLVGLFGVDFILKDGRARAVEVNPRYTASVEVFELAHRSSLLLRHRRVCDIEASGDPAAFDLDPMSATSGIVGKWIIYATQPLTFPDLLSRLHSIENIYAVPEIADIPGSGLMLNRGEPVMTVFGLGTSPRDCFGNLRSNLNRWRRSLGLALCN